MGKDLGIKLWGGRGETGLSGNGIRREGNDRGSHQGPYRVINKCVRELGEVVIELES